MEYLTELQPLYFNMQYFFNDVTLVSPLLTVKRGIFKCSFSSFQCKEAEGKEVIVSRKRYSSKMMVPYL